MGHVADLFYKEITELYDLIEKNVCVFENYTPTLLIWCGKFII